MTRTFLKKFLQDYIAMTGEKQCVTDQEACIRPEVESEFFLFLIRLWPLEGCLRCSLVRQWIPAHSLCRGYRAVLSSWWHVALVQVALV